MAAFFAYQHAPHAFGFAFDTLKNDAVAIWMLDTTHYIWSERYGVQIVAPPAWENIRMHSQSGALYPISHPHRSLQEYVGSFVDDGAGSLRLVVLPITEGPYALADLDLMGINSASMFPGLDGRARAAITPESSWVRLRMPAKGGPPMMSHGPSSPMPDNLAVIDIQEDRFYYRETPITLGASFPSASVVDPPIAPVQIKLTFSPA